MNDAMGDRFKEYEHNYRRILDPAPYAIIRVDGRAFHTYTRGLTKPFDDGFSLSMIEVGRALLDEIQGAIFVYGQSDEVSVLIDLTGEKSQPWFGGVLPKMVSISAATATAAFQQHRGSHRNPMFDSRAFTVPNFSEARNYFIWRQKDCLRNSVQSLAQSVFSQTELHGRSVEELKEMLVRAGEPWSSVPDIYQLGWIVTKTTQPLFTVEHLNWWKGLLYYMIPEASECCGVYPADTPNMLKSCGCDLLRLVVDDHRVD